MTGIRRWGLVAVPALALAGLVALGFHRPGPPLEPPSPFSFSGGRLTLNAGSKILTRLEIVEIGRAAQESRPFRAVGQVIALSNASESLTGEGIGWVELDPQLTASVGLTLDGGDAPATAYGLTSLAAEDAAGVARGQVVEIRRYGSRQGSVSGSVVRLVRRAGGDSVGVLFRFVRAQDWFPGTNCEIDFPSLRGHPVRIPTTAPVHEETREYVWKEVAPAQFAAQSVSVVDASPTEVAVLGLSPGDRIVGRGAILLKPLLKRVLATKGGGS